ncbi:MAG: NUDIX domain-containing protein [Leptolyngbyaceae cyanobacterium RU_5_1]|nr:NUDIX domain-containing protein [Leptolyngbyaceae cyanobacterium RU_5_1]
MTSEDTTETIEDSRPTVAIAVLHQNGQFLMQLRDDNPNIPYPGHWALFGGHLEPGETADIAIQRELLEEIGYAPPNLTLLTRVDDAKAIRYVYHGALQVGLEKLVLGEGLDMALLTLENIRQGIGYSQRIQQVRPIGLGLQTILLNFAQTQHG